MTLLSQNATLVALKWVWHQEALLFFGVFAQNPQLHFP